MIFANPLYFLLLILIVPLVAWYIFKLRKMQPTFKISSTSAFRGISGGWRTRIRHLPFVLRCLSLILIIIVLARPQAEDSWEKSTSEGIDIMVAMDISGSMLAQDFLPNRLEAAKKVVAGFISDRSQDKIGLVVFSGESFTQCPLTTDHRILLNLLQEVDNGIIEDGTAIGLGLANAVNRLKDSPSKSRVIILLTDGSNNKGQVAPLTAAEIAKSFGIRVYTIGVGTRGLAPSPVQTPFGIRYQNAPVDIDEETLTKIAGITGGEYFRATDNESLRKIYSQIDQMEKYRISVNKVTKRQELFLPFAIAALMLILGELILRRTVLRSIP